MCQRLKEHIHIESFSPTDETRMDGWVGVVNKTKPMWHSDGHICRDNHEIRQMRAHTHTTTRPTLTLSGQATCARSQTRNRVRLPSVISGSSLERKKKNTKKHGSKKRLQIRTKISMYAHTRTRLAAVVVAAAAQRDSSSPACQQRCSVRPEACELRPDEQR